MAKTDQKAKRPPKKNVHPQRAKIDEVNAAEAAARRVRALDMRIAGGSYRNIAGQLGISHEQARIDIKTAMAELDEVAADKADELRQLELARLDVMTVHAMNIMQMKDMAFEIRLKAIDRLVKITSERAKLQGLYLPYKVEHSGAIDFTAFLQELDSED